jgi:carotenoid 1,2-hydratase
VVIAFVGSVFSPYYARALRRGAASPEDHCAVNVALYGKGGHHWAMTERGCGELAREPESYRLGPSSLHWDEAGLTIRFNERTTPFFTRLAGEIRLTPSAVLGQSYALDAAGRHLWRPIAPEARVEVDIASPAQRWQGHGYFDTNCGERPVATDFVSWDWARAQTESGPLIHYDVLRRDGSRLDLSLEAGGDGTLVASAQPPLVPIAGTNWRVTRNARADQGYQPRVVATLEDTPFYARSLVRSRLNGAEALLMHESLSLDRLSSRWVETLLPFRMPRLRGRRPPAG